MGMTGFDLNKALTDIDERYWDEADSRKSTARMENVKTRKGGKKRTVRIVLLAACLVTLLAGSVAAANKALNNDNRFLTLMGSSNATEEFEEAYVPIGIVSKGDVTVTLENIIGDTNTIFCEFSTDYELENCPEGWLDGVYPGVHVKVSGKAFFADEEWNGKESIMAGFCRGGKLWFLYQMTYDNPDRAQYATLMDSWGEDWFIYGFGALADWCIGNDRVVYDEDENRTVLVPDYVTSISNAENVHLISLNEIEGA